MSRLVVIGAGLGGLAAAVTAAARGHRVTLLDKNPWLGGKAALLELPVPGGNGSFRFDMGPTILTMPRVLQRIVAETGRPLEQVLRLIRLDPQWRCFFADGRQIDLQEDIGAMAASMEAFAAGSGAGYRRFQAISRELHEISERFFFWKSVGGVVDTMDWRAQFSGNALRDLKALRMGQSMAGVVRKEVPDPQLAQMLDHFCQYVGSSPYLAPAVLAGIGDMQVSEGVWYPEGGTRAVAVALENLAGELGVELRPGCAATGIELEGGRVVAVKAGAERIACDAVVSNADAIRTMVELLPQGAIRPPKHEPACSGVVLYLGLDRRYPQLAHHSFVFSADPEAEFDAIYRQGIPAPDPSAYLAAPSVTDPSVAPQGGEALYILVHTPYIRPGQNWQEMLPGYRRVILDKLARTAGLEDIERHIVVERHLTPPDIRDRYATLDGAIYGLASHGRFAGAFKPGNRVKRIPGLYLAGGSAHPGPGMPMVLMSGWIAADTAHRDLTAQGTAKGAA